MACTSGCQTRDHQSYAECLRSKAPKVAYCNSAGGYDLTTQKRWDRDLDAYRSARAEGMQPAGTAKHHVEAAKAISDATGSAYQVGS